MVARRQQVAQSEHTRRQNGGQRVHRKIASMNVDRLCCALRSKYIVLFDVYPTRTDTNYILEVYKRSVSCQKQNFQKENVPGHLPTKNVSTMAKPFSPETEGAPGELECFVEILKASNEKSSIEPPYIDAYVATVDPPQQCGAVVKRLSAELPLRGAALALPVPDGKSEATSCAFDLSHLKRVKRIQSLVDSNLGEDRNGSNNQGSEDDGGMKPSTSTASLSTKKRPRCQMQLQVLLGPVAYVEQVLVQSTTNENQSREALSIAVQQRYDLIHLRIVPIPSRAPETQLEWKEFQQVWPTAYYPNKTSEHRAKALNLEEHEITSMQQGMKEALLDATKWTRFMSKPVGTIVVDPQSGNVVARSHEEYVLQGLSELQQSNPLQTSVILAIQAISRMERQVALQQGMDTPSFQGGQYLCTGFDVYTTLEPPVFEAMALVHARIRRLIFGCSDRSNETLGGLCHYNMHSLPGTNHKYRAFSCTENSDLWTSCQSLYNNT